uniref:AID-like deaminase 4a n=1 Tax=Strongylocentrotus purpuratus TaxID=7668 RepID=A0A2U8JQ23_STRPU|nr:AID-like deaminase 4a [Strongylocentrotus purpuratus]
MASMHHDALILRALSRSLASRFAASSWKTYAGVSLDRVTYDHDSRSSLPPHGRHLSDNMGLCVDDEFMATCPREPCTLGSRNAHAEKLILNWLSSRVNISKWPPADGQMHTLHLFTFLSPCSGCIHFLESFLRLLREKGLMWRIRFVLGYSKEYTPWKPGTPLAQRKVPGPDETIPWLSNLQTYYPNFRVIKIS